MAQSIRKVGVIGAGQMGNGIAHVCALAGIRVVLNDIAAPRLKEALATINGNMARQVARKRITEDRQAGGAQAYHHRRKLRRPRRLRSGDRGGDREGRGQAQDLRELCPSLKPEALVASNTSSISITRLAASTDRPEKFIGIHFMNPVPLMELVELIRGIATADATFEACQGVRHQARQDHRGGRGFPGLHRQPHPAADDQRGDLHALRGRRQRRGDRHRDAARRAPSDGAAGACRLHRARYLPVGDAGAARGPGGFEIPAVPAAGEIRRGRLARPKAGAASTTIAARSRCRRGRSRSYRFHVMAGVPAIHALLGKQGKPWTSCTSPA